MTHCFVLRDKLKVFFTNNHFHLSDHLHGDVFSRLNDLNLGLQGPSATTIFNVRDEIEAMIKKLELFSVCINKDNTQGLSIIV